MSESLEAYHFGFSATGCADVDSILQAIARAGRGAHHTEDWGEFGFVDKIQEAAVRCAARIAELESKAKP